MTLPDEQHLTAAEREKLAEIAETIVNDSKSTEILRIELSKLETAGCPNMAAELFEMCMYRVDTFDFWIYFCLTKVYANLRPEGRRAALLAAAVARQIAPDGPMEWHAYRQMFQLLCQLGRTDDAVALFRHELARHPYKPICDRWELRPLLQTLGEDLPDDGRPLSAPGARRDHLVFPRETRPAWSCSAADGIRPQGLVSLETETWERPSVIVAELPDAELLIFNDTLIALDRDRVMHADLSVAAYPHAILNKIQQIEADGLIIPEYSAAEAVVIADYFSPPNLCHFLLDQLTRLAVYQQLDVDTSTATVVAAEPNELFQMQVLRRAGVTSLLSTNRLCRVRIQRLWVSNNCRDVRHFGHRGAAWAIDFVRRTLGGQGTKGWRRLYVSRNDAAKRRVVNEDEVMRLLEPLGFEMIVPGKMPYEAQLAAFKQASDVIAPHGAALAHMVVCPPQSNMLEIFHPIYTETAFAMQVDATGIGYAALVAQDGASDAPEYNDPSRGGAMHLYIDRDIRVPIDRLARYLGTRAW